MMDFLSKLLDVLMQAGAALMAYLLARDRASARELSQRLETEHEISQAGAAGPRDQSDAAQRLRNGTF